MNHPRGRRVALGAILMLLCAGCRGLRSQVAQQITQARQIQGRDHDALAH